MSKGRPINLQGGHCFCFVQNCFSDYTRVGIKKNCGVMCEDFFQNLTLGYMTKTLNQICFPPPKSEYVQQHWESEYFFRKKVIASPPLPWKLNVPSLI